MKKILLIVGAALGVKWIYEHIMLADKLIFGIASMQASGSILNPSLAIRLTAKNPTTYSATITNMVADIFLNGSIVKVADMVLTNPVTIQPGSTSDLHVNVKFLNNGIIDTIINLLSSNSGSKFYIKGWATVDNIPLPLNLNY